MELIVFLFYAFALSLTGVMAPGAMTTSTITIGMKNRWAGALISIGHGVVEFPLMILLIFGVGSFFNIDAVKMVIGIGGGGFLIFLAWQTYGGLKNLENQQPAKTDRPILTGIVLSVGNPYFLLWWASIGLNLMKHAMELGAWAFVIFAVMHWSLDLIWLSILSWSSFKGSRVFSLGTQKVVIMFCAVIMFLFGVKFVFDAVKILFS